MLAYVLTFGRPVLAACFAALAALSVGEGGGLSGPAAAGLLVLACLAEATDMLDGWAARRAGSAGELGGLLDPLMDSLSRLTMYFAAALAGWVWIGVPLTMAGRDIVVAYVRVIVGRGGGRTSARLSGKCKAMVQGAGLLAIVVLSAGWLGLSPGRTCWARTAVAAAVIAVTVWSLIDYIRGGWPAVKEMYKQGRQG